MTQAIFYKEWIKTYRISFILLLAFLCSIAYTYINTAQAFRVTGAINVWEGIITKDTQIMPEIKWLPILAGILLALTQYVPEMQNKRLKLTLHLPLSETKLVSTMLVFGTIVLLVLYTLAYIALLSGLSSYYPQEFIYSAWISSLPWFIAGLMSYLLAAWICLEPMWKQRILNALFSVCILSFLYISEKQGVYAPFIPYLLGSLVIIFSFPFYAVARFKEGVQ